MTVRWTVRAANDRRASSPRIKAPHPHQRQVAAPKQSGGYGRNPDLITRRGGCIMNITPIKKTESVWLCLFVIKSLYKLF